MNRENPGGWENPGDCKGIRAKLASKFGFLLQLEYFAQRIDVARRKSVVIVPSLFACQGGWWFDAQIWRSRLSRAFKKSERVTLR